MPVILTDRQKKLARRLTGWKFKLYLLSRLPMGGLAGIRIMELNEDRCIASVPFKWWNKNPFQSMYFAVMSMAAELSTAATCLLAVEGQKPSIAFIIVGNKAEYTKKATSKIYFTCTNGSKAFDAVEKSKSTGEPEVITISTTGRNREGEEVARFEFTWSFKQRRSKVGQ